MEKKDDYMEVDLLRLFQALWKKAWAILIAMLIVGGCACTYTLLFVTPLYKAQTKLYVNNTALSVGDAKLSISQGDITAAKSLIDTYGVILKTRSTVDEIIEQSGVSYNYEELVDMISSGSVNGTEIFYVEVTSPKPKEAENIANIIGQVLPERIASIVDGSSVRIVDYAVVPAHKSSPSISKNTILGCLLGFVLACGVVVVRELMDDQIHDSDYLLQTYDLPVLAVVPDLMSPENGAVSYGSNTNKGGKKQ